MAKRVQGGIVIFAFYSPTDEILLRGTKVVNPSAKAALKEEFRGLCKARYCLKSALMANSERLLFGPSRLTLTAWHRTARN